MTEMDPKERYTAEQCLKHPWIEKIKALPPEKSSRNKPKKFYKTL
jgi:serine/threonine protein kinase